MLTIVSKPFLPFILLPLWAFISDWKAGHHKRFFFRSHLEHFMKRSCLFWQYFLASSLQPLYHIFNTLEISLWVFYCPDPEPFSIFSSEISHTHSFSSFISSISHQSHILRSILTQGSLWQPTEDAWQC